MTQATLLRNPVVAMRDNSPVGLLSASCPEPPPPRPPALAHVFGEEELEKVARQPDIDVVVAHGVDRHVSAMEMFARHVEVCPVFVSAGQDVHALDLDDILAALSDRGITWKALGGHGSVVDVLLHGGELQRRSCERLFQRIGCRVSALGRHVSRLRDYEALSREAVRRSDCLIIGLRQLDIPGLRVVAVDGRDVYDWRYPLQMEVRVLARRTVDSREFASRIWDKIRMRIASGWDREFQPSCH